MSKMIQLRHVPDPLHQTLTKRARRARMSLSDYLVVELQRSAERPTRSDILARLSRLRPVASRAQIVAALRQERARR